MKINISSIVIDHIDTLYDSRSERLSYVDLSIFFALPICIGLFAYIAKFSIKTDFYNVSITFFGIFIALLLNIQVATFSIFNRTWKTESDPKLMTQQSAELSIRKKLLGEINANVSYLVLFCCAALVTFIVLYVFDLRKGVPPAVSVAIYAHFILTLIMIVKRSHALFQKEYR